MYLDHSIPAVGFSPWRGCSSPCQADRVTTPQLMRVYGALMWSLGKVIDTPEVSRVYIGTLTEKIKANISMAYIRNMEGYIPQKCGLIW